MDHHIQVIYFTSMTSDERHLGTRCSVIARDYRLDLAIVKLDFLRQIQAAR